ncbi:MAG: redoxin domain-containing protein [Gammaproteobacteria bacterium]|jgi:thiol-disulfide isomerase/thioredoxin|nr:redoxin domain-containing protein [Gammaproteobacteria bacterium]
MRLLVLVAALLVASSVAAEKVDFTLPDLEGKSVSLSDFRGKWVIVNYWATWCPPCLEEIPDLVALYEANPDKIVVLGVDYEEVDLDYLKEFTDSHFMSYPIVRMDPVPVTELGPVLGLPTSYIVSPEGVVVARQEGPVTREAIETYLERKQQQLDDAKPVSTSAAPATAP